MMNRIEHTALSLRGTPFKHQGRDLKEGLDCAGLVAYVLKKSTGLSPSIPDNYPKSVRGSYIVDVLEDHLEKADGLPIGGVVTFWVDKPGIVRHLGIIVRDGFVHSSPSYGTMFQSWTDKWEKRIQNVYVYRGK